MISKPKDWDSMAVGTSKVLPMGGYVLIVHDVIDHEDQQCLEIQYDVCEGEYKGIALDAYEHWGNWSYSFKLYYTQKALWRFKLFTSMVEKTNPGFVFDFKNPKCLVKKGFGAVIGYQQYWDKKTGKLRNGRDVQDFCTAADMREGKMPSQPVEKPPRTGKPVAAAPTPAYAQTPAYSDDDGELPF